MSNCTNLTEFDGDIAGLGVRLSFYFQNFILVLLVDRSYEDAENALWTFIATSFGLTVAALVQVRGGDLSLLEGILASQLTWLANIGTFLALASYSRSKGEDVYVKMAAVFQGYFSMVLTIVMWNYADRFPQEPSSCVSQLRFVWLFGWELPVLSSGRVLALVFASLAMVVYTGMTFTECRTWMKTGRSRILMREPDVETTANTADRPQGGGAPRGHTSRHGRRHRRRRSSASESRRRQRPPIRTQWLGMDVDPIFFGIFLSQVIVLTYFISTTELIIKRSGAHSTDPKRWGFGQVLALTVVIPSLIALSRAIRHNSIARLQTRETERKNEMSRAPGGSPITGHQPRLRLETSRSGSTPRPSPAHFKLPSSPNGAESPPASGLAPPTALDGSSSIFSVSTAT